MFSFSLSKKKKNEGHIHIITSSHIYPYLPSPLIIQLEQQVYSLSVDDLPTSDDEPYTFVGCYEDRSKDRVLSKTVTPSERMTTEVR